MNLQKTKFDIQLTRGDTYSFTFDISQLTALDLSSAYLTCKKESDPNAQVPIFQKRLGNGIAKIDDGLYQVSIGRNDTKDLSVEGYYFYDIEVKYDEEIKTIASGRVILLQDYTNPQNE